MKTLILNISDIHVSSLKPENEGLVLKAFIDDVREQTQKYVFDNAFVFIGGDLVHAASDDSYSKFDDIIIQPLMEILNIGRNRFIIVPGNHDLNRSCVDDVKESLLPIFNKKYNENDFNDLLRKDAQQNILFGKFQCFDYFMKNTMGQKDYSMTCGVYELNDIWSVHTLNTAILSLGGYNDIEDIAHLGVDTRALHKNLSDDNHPKKILLMHHPEDFCMDWVKHELRKLYHDKFDLILSGHTHDQELFCQRNSKYDYVHCEAPQLFTDKYDDVLGYNFIMLEDEHLDRIIYREWFEKRNKFRSGSAFTEDESGVECFDYQKDPKTVGTDKVALILQNRLREAMEAFVGQPYIWIERHLSDDRIDQIFKMSKSTLYSEMDIINKGENIRVVAPSQYGLTCYGLHFLITLWQNYGQFGVMINADGVRTRRFELLVEKELEIFGKEKLEVKWIVIDNWNPYKKDQAGISAYITKEFPKVKVLLMAPFHEHNFNKHTNINEILPIHKTLYLTPLKHEQERLIVDEYNRTKYIDESDSILQKLDDDIKNFNMHRTPYSCITLLTVFKDSFDRNPVNRTSVLENILHIIFDNTKLPSYKSANPDVKDCEFCLGYFCSQIIENEYYYFSRDDFYSTIRDFCKKKKTEVDINHLFDILCYNKIIIDDNGSYTFRFSFWVYYFVASWMFVDKKFAKKMLANQQYHRYPEVLEFYTGKDRKRKDAVSILSKDLKNAYSKIQSKIGIPEDSNPFDFLRFRMEDGAQQRIIKEIDNNIQKSNLPQEIKDQIADLSFNPSAAFHQEIDKVYSDFSVGYLINLITIACKALRNSDHLDADDKMQLLHEVTSALKVLSNIIYLVSHLFAKQGYIYLPDYGWKLSDSFNGLCEEDKRIRIIVCIPLNLMRMFKEDLYSRKLSPVYIDMLKNEKDKAQKHILAFFVVSKQPEGWEPAIREYVDGIGKDSYYLGTLTEIMQDIYMMEDLEAPDRMRMNNLIKMLIFKAEKGCLPKSLSEIRKIPLGLNPNIKKVNEGNDSTGHSGEGSAYIK